ncbi:hypothetical protein [Alicyclobacillus sp. ALC3]|uniref:hypothetical protein n=1 Tax=Alicyclobacillus sp. ALC3 TaxID=2796143 RepID=UPI002379ED61|nr:hypothetical protein [Alicyclobacillus sp. ALC3]WDL97245.1 hypothetical protein JC200_00315 [Alicyclobacillus sp. ALC3]
MRHQAAAKQAMKKAAQAKSGSPWATLLVSVNSFAVVALASVYWLTQNQWVAGERYWVISRAAALAAFLVLTVVVAIGLILSHPKNKAHWHLTPKLLPWHQALMAALFALIGLHLFFTAIDSKSGINGIAVFLPIHSQYHPLAVELGAAGLYLLLFVFGTASLRKWVRVWLPIHRLSWLTWVVLCVHGFFAGTDTHLRFIYWTAGTLLFLMFFWRHWTNNERKPLARPTLAKTRQSQKEVEP